MISVLIWRFIFLAEKRRSENKMKMLKKSLSIFLALTMLLTAIFTMVSCGDGNADDTGDTNGTDNGSADQSGTGTYVVSVASIGGLPLSGVYVYVYADSTLADLKGYSETGNDGKATFELPVSSDYAVVISGVPKGYKVEEYYQFSGNTAVITLHSSVVADESMAGAKLSVGNIMYDFSVTTPDGETVTLSEVLKDKKVVVLNFWYNGCSACELEFPYMQEAYDMYEGDVEIIAVDPLFDSASTKGYQESRGLTFTMASVSSNWTTAFNVNGGDIDAYPTTVIIDRYGTICMIEEGALVSLRYWTSIFEHFTANDYKQKIIGSADDLLTQVAPTYEMPSSDEIAAAVNDGEITVTYRADEEDEYSWPFIKTEKIGEECLKASNAGIDGSYAIIYADVELKAGEAFAFDYISSSERFSDIMFVIVNDEDIYQISGIPENEVWTACYPCVAEEDGTYKVALCYLKDDSTGEGDDTVYVDNFRVVDADKINVATYIPRYAASTEDGINYDYVDVFYNEYDGYYHVGSVNGPLLLADLMNTTVFSEENSIYLMALNGDVTVGGYNYYDDMLPYFNYASNSQINGICTVTKELAEYLKITASVLGFDGTENEWLKICKYYQSYGTNGEQLEDPIKGLSAESAYKATLGVGVETNFFFYDRVIMPRGLRAEFIPTVSGVYRITSRNESAHGVDGWIFAEDGTELLVFERDERMFNIDGEVSMLLYMEAGTPYYIDIAFWDLYEVGYIYYDIEFVAAQYDHFRLASPGYFTYDSNATGDAMYRVIAGGIDVILGSDGYYYEDLGKDASGEQIYGSLLYADFSGITGIFSSPVATVPSYDENGNPAFDENGDPIMIKGMIELGGFDFSKTEDDFYILGIIASKGGDIDATDKYLRETWGEDYDSYAEIYRLEDIYDGIYHGRGEDLTDEISKFLPLMLNEKDHPERAGCVPVSEELAAILQLLMDKYTFENVENSWRKLCYYYDHLGPDA